VFWPVVDAVEQLAAFTDEVVPAVRAAANKHNPATDSLAEQVLLPRSARRVSE